jgi:Na+-transporting methylmalonyl-CoA/oxaloacetate decarboxylase gamma subunit
MLYEVIQNNDSLKVIKDTLSTAQENSDVFSDASFDISRIGSDGIILSVLGYAIVFLALLVLFLLFSNLTKLLQINLRKKLKASGHIAAEKEELAVSGETNAAIATAIYLHFQEAHDFENTVITIKKVQRSYSPWSSKLHGLRQSPRK